MEIDLKEIFQTAQKMVPQVPLEIAPKGKGFTFEPVGIEKWGFYLEAMWDTWSSVQEEVESFPDTEIFDDLYKSLYELGCLVASVQIFYGCMMKDLHEFSKDIKVFFDFKKKNDNKSFYRKIDE